MSDRIAKLELDIETFRRNMDFDDDKEAINLKSSYLLGDSKLFSTLAPTKPLIVGSIHNGDSGTVTIIKAVRFKGIESENFLLWLHNYEQISHVNWWSEDYKVVHIATVLQENANRKY